jgi:hypothetical protein
LETSFASQEICGAPSSIATDGKNKYDSFFLLIQYTLNFFPNSLASTPFGHENVGIAYANKSVVYMTLGFYKIALENLQLARNNGYPQSKLEKLADREKACVQKIRAGESKEGAFQ